MESWGSRGGVRLVCKAGDGDPDGLRSLVQPGLCLAWLGDNQQSIACLDHVVSLESESAFEHAVDAWTLAEVLRQGGGPETPADDLRFACTVAWEPGDTPWLLDEFPEISRLPTPIAPGDAPRTVPGSRYSSARMIPCARHRPTSASRRSTDRPGERFHQPESLRLSSPRVETLERIEELSSRGSVPAPGRSGAMPRRFHSRFSTPISGSFDPAEVDPVVKDQLQREWLEQYFENQWIHRPRHGLDDRSPLDAARQARRGDAVARAKLTAVVRASRADRQPSQPGRFIRDIRSIGCGGASDRAGRCRHGRSHGPRLCRSG